MLLFHVHMQKDTVLHCAAEYNRLNIVQLLIEVGADLAVTDGVSHHFVQYYSTFVDTWPTSLSVNTILKKIR